MIRWCRSNDGSGSACSTIDCFAVDIERESAASAPNYITVRLLILCQAMAVTAEIKTVKAIAENLLSPFIATVNDGMRATIGPKTAAS